MTGIKYKKKISMSTFLDHVILNEPKPAKEVSNRKLCFNVSAKIVFF